MNVIITLLSITILCSGSSYAVELRGTEKDAATEIINGLAGVGKKEDCACEAQSGQVATEFSSWTEMPESDAQCTPGALSAHHSARVRILSFHKYSAFRIEELGRPTTDAVKGAVQSHTQASYIGNPYGAG